VVYGKFTLVVNIVNKMLDSEYHPVQKKHQLVNNQS